MSINAVYEIVKEQSGLFLTGLVILMTLVQITPIKINPWSWLVKWLGRNLTSDLSSKIDKVDLKLEKHIKESDERDLRKRRESILDFASAVGNGRSYSKEQYEQMLRECDEYTQYCHEKEFINSVADESIKLIKTAYSQHLHANDFLQGIYYIMPKDKQ